MQSRQGSVRAEGCSLQLACARRGAVPAGPRRPWRLSAYAQRWRAAESGREGLSAVRLACRVPRAKRRPRTEAATPAPGARQARARGRELQRTDHRALVLARAHAASGARAAQATSSNRRAQRLSSSVQRQVQRAAEQGRLRRPALWACGRVVHVYVTKSHFPTLPRALLPDLSLLTAGEPLHARDAPHVAAAGEALRARRRSSRPCSCLYGFPARRAARHVLRVCTCTCRCMSALRAAARAPEACSRRYRKGPFFLRPSLALGARWRSRSQHHQSPLFGIPIATHDAPRPCSFPPRLGLYAVSPQRKASSRITQSNGQLSQRCVREACYIQAFLTDSFCHS